MIDFCGAQKYSNEVMTIKHWAWFNPLLISKGFDMDKKQLMGFLIVFSTLSINELKNLPRKTLLQYIHK
jgi:hypothetical protein